MKKATLNRYEKILARKDGARPMTLDEFVAQYAQAGKCFVLNCKLLTQRGNTLELSWSEREADAEAKRRKQP